MPPKSSKGLHNFIAEVRACPSKQAEQKRIDQELAKIRRQFAQPRTLSAYDRKKYVWKLTYIHILGYDVDFGGIEAVNLVSSHKYSEKVTGYVACSLLLQGVQDVERLIINIIRMDLSNQNVHIASLALHCVANMGSQEIAENVFSDVQRLANVSNVAVPPSIRKKAYIAMLQIFRTDSSMLPPEVWAPRLGKSLQTEVDVGCTTSLCSLILGLIEDSTVGWDIVLPSVVQALKRISREDVPANGYYHGVAAPWLQIKLMRILQFFPPIADKRVFSQLTEILHRAVQRLSIQERVAGIRRRSKADQERMNRTNAEQAVLFEAFNLVIHYAHHLPLQIRHAAATRLGEFAASKEANVRHLALESMSRLAMDPTEIVNPIKRHIPEVLNHLSDPDPSISRQALSLLYALCDRDNWQFITDKLLETLRTTEHTRLQEELALKIAIVVEKNVPDFSWYVDVVFKMIEYAPECVSEEIWYRAVQVVTGFDQQDAASLDKLQSYAARKAYDYLTDQYTNETMVRLGAYLLGEFGHHISDEATGRRQLNILHKHWTSCGSDTRAILLTAYAKLYNAHDDIRDEVLIIMEDNLEDVDPEVQQRASEFYNLLQGKEDVMESVLGMMPTFSAGVQNNNSLIRRMKQAVEQKGRAASRAQLEETARTAGNLLKPSTDFVSAAHFPDDEDAPQKRSSASEESSSNDSRRSSDSNSDGSDRGGGDASSSSSGRDEDGSSSSGESSAESDSSDSRGAVGRREGTRSLSTTTAAPQSPSPGGLQLGPPLSMDVRTLWKRLCILTTGPLYDARPLSIALHQEYRDSTGRLRVKFVNRSDYQRIHIQRVSVQSTPGLSIEAEPFEAVVGPGNSEFHMVHVRCTQPFLNPPKYLVQATVSSEHGAPPATLNLPFTLPVTLAKFITPTPLEAGAFQRYWGELADREAVLSGPAAPDFTSAADVLRYLTANGAFNLSGTQAGSCTFGSGTLTLAQQKPTPFACMARVDFDSARRLCRIAVRAAAMPVSQALVQLMATYLIFGPQGAQQRDTRASSALYPAYPST